MEGNLGNHNGIAHQETEHIPLKYMSLEDASASIFQIEDEPEHVLWPMEMEPEHSIMTMEMEPEHGICDHGDGPRTRYYDHGEHGIVTIEMDPEHGIMTTENMVLWP